MIKKKKKLKKFLILKIIRKKFNIKLNRLIRIKIKKNIILIVIIIFQKLIKIFICNIPKNLNLKQIKIKRYKIMET